MLTGNAWIALTIVLLITGFGIKSILPVTVIGIGICRLVYIINRNGTVGYPCWWSGS